MDAGRWWLNMINNTLKNIKQREIITMLAQRLSSDFILDDMDQQCMGKCWKKNSERSITDMNFVLPVTH